MISKFDKMKILYFLILLLLVSNSYSQPFIWGKNFGGWVDDYPVDLEKTEDGLILTTSETGYQSKLRKLDLDGNLKWEFDFMGDRPFDLLASCVDPDGNVYTIMSISDNVTIDTIDNIPVYPGVSLIKLDNNGKVLWSKKIGGSTTGNNLFYFNGEIFLAGIFQGTMNIDDKKILTSQKYYNCFSWKYEPGEDFYCARIDTEGTVVDAISFGEDYPDFLAASTMDAETGNIYITGLSDYYSGCGVIPYTILMKIGPDFSVAYNKTISREENDSYLFYPSNIFYSSNGNLYLWGYNPSGISTEDFQLEGPSDGTSFAGLLEYQSTDGNFVKAKQFDTKSINPIWAGSLSTLTNNKAYMFDDGTDSLIIFASSRNQLDFDIGSFTPSAETSKYNETFNNENLLLFKIDRETFHTRYLASIKGSLNDEGEFNLDNPGPAFLDSCYLYFSAAFTENPIEVFGNSVYNNSGNGDTDVLLSKIDIWKVQPEKPGAGVSREEYKVLVDFYYESDGENWFYNDNWLDTIHSTVDNWYGISVKEGHVTSIVMAANNLTKIPNAITRLPYLRKLVFSSGEFHGEIPNLENCPNLSWLDLSDNNFFYADIEKVTQWKNYDQIGLFYNSQNVTYTVEIDTTVKLGDTIVLEIPGHEPDTRDYYFWWTNCQNPDAYQSSDYPYIINNIIAEDDGRYELTLRNSKLPNLIKTYLKIQLHVDTSDISTSSNDIKKFRLKIFPNPAKDKVALLCNEPIESIRLFNIWGQILIDRKNTSSKELDVSGLKNGIYVLEIKPGNSSAPFVHKVVIQR